MLTDTKVRNTKPGSKPIKLTDSGGLYLEVRPTGAKLWRFRYRLAGKANVFALGQYHNDKREGHVSLVDARGARDKTRVLVRQGVHPAHQRKAGLMMAQNERANTFEAVAVEWISKNEKRWALTYQRQIENTLTADVYQWIGTMPIKDVTPAHILEIMRRVLRR